MQPDPILRKSDGSILGYVCGVCLQVYINDTLVEDADPEAAAFRSVESLLEHAVRCCRCIRCEDRVASRAPTWGNYCRECRVFVDVESKANDPQRILRDLLHALPQCQDCFLTATYGSHERPAPLWCLEHAIRRTCNSSVETPLHKAVECALSFLNRK